MQSSYIILQHVTKKIKLYHSYSYNIFIKLSFTKNVTTCKFKINFPIHRSITNEPAIYSLVPDEKNFLDWGSFKECCWNNGIEMPLCNMIWIPILLFAESEFTYKLLILLYHIIPGYFIDLMLFIMGKPTR